MGKKYDIDRRSYLVNKSFQFRFIWTMLIPVFLFAVIVLLTSLFIFWPIIQSDIDDWGAHLNEVKHSLITTYDIAVSDTSSTDVREAKLEKHVNIKRLLRESPKVNVYNYLSNSMVMLFINLIIALLIVTIMAFRASHRLMGPVPRFRKKMDEIAAGDLTVRADFRDKDEFKELIEGQFNHMMDEFLQRVTKIQEDTNSLSSLIKNDDGIPTEVKKAVASIEKDISKFKI